MSTLSLQDRMRGCLLGLACGDALGTAVEFSPRGSFTPLTDMVGGGVFGLAPGQWTDDTSMALCLAYSLLERQGFDAQDQMNRYVNWWQWGYCSATGECFDIGGTVSAALQRYLLSGNPLAGDTDPQTAGNGALMRLAPVVMFFYPDAQAVQTHARLSTQTTHGAQEALDCSALLAAILQRALSGAPGAAWWQDLPATLELTSPAVQALATGKFIQKSEAEIQGTGYCVASLEAALWCCWHSRSFEEAVLRAANLGDDADTTAAIAGQVAGATWGASGIAPHWLRQLHQSDEIDRVAHALAAWHPLGS